MQKSVILSEKEWRSIPIEIGEIMYKYAKKKDGFKIVSKEDGEEITERLDDWFVGIIVRAFSDYEAGRLG